MQAFEEAKLKVKTINQFLDKMEKKNNKPDTYVKDLVSSFLIPDVERKKVQRQVQFEERKYLEAARKTIQQSVGLTGNHLDTEAMNLQMQRAQEGIASRDETAKVTATPSRRQSEASSKKSEKDKESKDAKWETDLRI